MKKTFLFVILLICCVCALPAKGMGDLFRTYPDFIDKDLHNILKEKQFEKDEGIIAQSTEELSSAQREQLFTSYKISAWDGIEGNFLFIFPKLGGGSFNQGDYGGASFLFVTGITGWACFGTGMLAMMFPIIALFPAIGMELKSAGSVAGVVATGVILSSVGISILLVDTVYGLVRPIVYANRQNKYLERALGTGKQADFGFAPLINPLTKEFGLIASIRL